MFIFPRTFSPITNSFWCSFFFSPIQLYTLTHFLCCSFVRANLRTNIDIYKNKRRPILCKSIKRHILLDSLSQEAFSRNRTNCSNYIRTTFYLHLVYVCVEMLLHYIPFQRYFSSWPFVCAFGTIKTSSYTHTTVRSIYHIKTFTMWRRFFSFLYICFDFCSCSLSTIFLIFFSNALMCFFGGDMNNFIDFIFR